MRSGDGWNGDGESGDGENGDGESGDDESGDGVSGDEVESCKKSIRGDGCGVGPADLTGADMPGTNSESSHGTGENTADRTPLAARPARCTRRFRPSCRS
jgi:hypothetical protein